MKTKNLSFLGFAFAVISAVLVASGCDDGAVDATVTGYGLPGAAEPAELEIRHDELTAGYDFGLTKPGTLSLSITTTATANALGTGIAGYAATGKFTDGFGVEYPVSNGYVDTQPTGAGSYIGQFYGTIGGVSVGTSGKYVSGTLTGTATPYTLTISGVSANVLEPKASLYVVSYKKAAIDASHQFGFRFVGTNTFIDLSSGSSILSSAGFDYTTVSGYPVTNALVTDNAAGDKAKAYDPDLVTLILSVNDFINGTAASVPDPWETKEFEFGFLNQQPNHDISFTWLPATVKR